MLCQVASHYRADPPHHHHHHHPNTITTEVCMLKALVCKCVVVVVLVGGGGDGLMLTCVVVVTGVGVNVAFVSGGGVCGGGVASQGFDKIAAKRDCDISYRNTVIHKVPVRNAAEECRFRAMAKAKAEAIRQKKLAPMAIETILGLEDKAEGALEYEIDDEVLEQASLD